MIRPTVGSMLRMLLGYALWLIFVFAWQLSERRTVPTIATPGRRRERVYLLVISAALVMIVVAPVTLKAGRIWVNLPLLDWTGLLVIAAGVALCWWARLHLGRLWSAEVTYKQGHRLVDSGPYRLVRHPIYTGFIMMYVGLAILCATLLALAGVLVMTVGLWLKARLEEQFLFEELGPVIYGAYQARTPMFVPRMPRRPEPSIS
jgi:protein-S-isoprenylcysteine O-methyltransferase Ste14